MEVSSTRVIGGQSCWDMEKPSVFHRRMGKYPQQQDVRVEGGGRCAQLTASEAARMKARALQYQRQGRASEARRGLGVRFAEGDGRAKERSVALVASRTDRLAAMKASMRYTVAAGSAMRSGADVLDRKVV